MNKKGFFIFEPIIVLTLIGVLLFASTATLNDKREELEDPIGEKAFNIIDTYQEAENELFKVDQNAKYSLLDSLYTLAADPTGRGDIVSCFESKDPPEPIDYFEYEKLTEETIKNNLLNYFKQIFDKRNENKNINYEYTTEGNLIVRGITEDKLNFYIETEGTYKIKPQFTVETSYALGIYNEIKDGIDFIISDVTRNCGISSSESLKTECVRDAVDIINSNKEDDIFNWKIYKIENEVYFFEITHRGKPELCVGNIITRLALPLKSFPKGAEIA